MKFNVFKKKNQVVKNHEGAKAYGVSPELALYSAVVTTSLEPLTYETTNERLKRIKNLIRSCNPTFVARLAIYARTEMHLRSVPLVLVIELAKIHSGDSLVSDTLYKVIQRADELAEALAYYQFTNKRKDRKKLNRLSKQVQKGIAKAFTKFDEYQFAKYNRNTEVKLKDALFLSHPKAHSEEMQSLFNKIVNDNLQTPYTWETELSKIGQQHFPNDYRKKQVFKQTWEALIDSNKLGYMALMRNLRNILEADVSAAHIEKIANYLSNENAVLKSKQFPFRYLAAYREIQQCNSSYTSYILEALEKAVQISANNIKGFDLNTKVVIASDVSGSMYKNISAKSSIQCYDIGLMLSMLLQNVSKNVITGIFGDRWMTYQFPKGNILQNVMALKRIEGKVGYSTNGHKVIEDLHRKRMVVDKVMVFTDMQLWNSSYGTSTLEKAWKAYKKEVAPNASLYLFDLVGYGQAPIQINQNDVFLIAGWSDKVFQVLDAVENGEKALNVIKSIKI